MTTHPKKSTPNRCLRVPKAIDRARQTNSDIPLTEVLAICRVAENRVHYGCFFFNERRATELTLLLGVGPTAFIMLKRMKGQDIFGIGPEIVHVIVPIVIGGGASCSV